MSPGLQSLLEGLFEKSIHKRLGYNGASEVKNHPWFEKVDWSGVQSKKIKPPFIPKLKTELDLTYFDDQFTKCDINSFHEPDEIT